MRSEELLIHQDKRPGWVQHVSGRLVSWTYLQVSLDVEGDLQHVLRLEALHLLPEESQGQDGRLQGQTGWIRTSVRSDPEGLGGTDGSSYLCFGEGDPAQTGFQLSFQLLQAQRLLPVRAKTTKSDQSRNDFLLLETRFLHIQHLTTQRSSAR